MKAYITNYMKTCLISVIYYLNNQLKFQFLPGVQATDNFSAEADLCRKSCAFFAEFHKASKGLKGVGKLPFPAPRDGFKPRVWLRVQGLGFRVLGLRVQDLGFRD